MVLRLVSILQFSISPAVFSKSPGNGLECDNTWRWTIISAVVMHVLEIVSIHFTADCVILK